MFALPRPPSVPSDPGNNQSQHCIGSAGKHQTTNPAFFSLSLIIVLPIWSCSGQEVGGSLHARRSPLQFSARASQQTKISAVEDLLDLSRVIFLTHQALCLILKPIEVCETVHTDRRVFAFLLTAFTLMLQKIQIIALARLWMDLKIIKSYIGAGEVQSKYLNYAILMEIFSHANALA